MNLFVSRVSGKYFDQQFLKRYISLPSVFTEFITKRTIRGIAYLGFVVFNQDRLVNCFLLSKGLNKNRFAYKWLPFNYREIARTRDWVIGYVYFTLMALLIVFIFIGTIYGAIVFFHLK